MAVSGVFSFATLQKKVAEDANQELSSPLELAENLRKLEKATVARNLGGWLFGVQSFKAQFELFLLGFGPLHQGVYINNMFVNYKQL